MKLKLFIFTFLISVLSFAQTKGTLNGTITDKELNNETLPFANVTLKGTKINTTTDIDGKYSISLAPGKYVVQFSFIGYEPVEESVTIEAGKTTTVDKALAAGGYKLEDVVVKSTVNREKESALLLEQKNAVEIKQAIGAQEMARKGVSNVEQGLTKITGITKVDSRGIFVRGLEDRYNNLLVNNLAVPSNSPYKKIIPLDLFSTDIVSTIDVYKTFNSNISGDFAGATFNITTAKATKSETKVSIGVGYTTSNNLSDFLIASDANTTKGLFGLTGDSRQIPSVLGTIPSNKELTTAESNNGLKSGWNVDNTSSPLNTSIGFLHSEKFNLENNNDTFSYLLSLNADNSSTIKKGDSNTFDTNGTFNNRTTSAEYSYKTSASALLNLNYKTSKLNLSSNTFYLRSTDNTILDQRGAFSGFLENKNVIVRTNQLDQSDYLNTQLLGEYSIKENSKLRAGLSAANTVYSQPDRKIYRGNIDSNDNISVSYGANNFLRQYLDVKSDSYFSGLLEYDLTFGKKQNKVSFGYNGNAYAAATSYRFIKTNSTDFDTKSVKTTLNGDIDTILTKDLNNSIFNYQENSNTSFATRISENTNAAFSNLFYKITDKFDVTAGLRVEKFSRELKYRFNGSFSDAFEKNIFDKNYILPSLNIKYALTEKTNIRFAGSKNYTKPVSMEVLPISYINGDGTSVQGNQALINSDNINLDLKYEFFPTSKEVFTASVFTKHIDNPIERTFRGEAGGSIVTYLNSTKADIYGIELEGILDLGRFSESLKSLSLGFNTTLMDSKAIASAESSETHSERELQGASKWLINSDLKYDFNFSNDWSNTISLVYSVFGKRIYSVGSIGLDHIYELPVQQLDFVWSSKISKNYSMKFSVNNILNPYRTKAIGTDTSSIIKFIADSDIVTQYKKGVGFGLSLNYTF